MVEGGVPFPMLSDGPGHIGRVYGVYDDVAGVEMRGRFLIDPDGVVQAIEILTPPVGRNVAELIRQIQAFQHVRKRKAQRQHRQGGKLEKPPSSRAPILLGRYGKFGKLRKHSDRLFKSDCRKLSVLRLLSTGLMQT